MKISKKMQEVVTKLAAKHGLDLAQPGDSVRLDMPGFDRLMIERAGEKLVSVAHYYEQRGCLMPDPEIVFFTGESGWIAMEISQILGGRRVYATLSSDGQELTSINPDQQASLARFAEVWAGNIESQGWLEDGQKWDPCDPARAQAPDLETLIAWEARGGCEAVDSCWVEPDGICPHGCPSWLLVMGLI